MNRIKMLAWVGFVLLILISPSLATLPVVIMHGVLDSYSTMEPLAEAIRAAKPGVEVVSLDIYNDLESVASMMDQWQAAATAMRNLPPVYKGGYTCIGFSQGNQVMRGLLELWPEHGCKTYISLSGPLMGQYGITDALKFFYPNYTREEVHIPFYTALLQNHFSLAQYWRDPFNLPTLEEVSTWIVPLDNLGSNYNATHRESFLRLNKLILVGGPDDGVITPWQSALFGFYSPQSSTEITDMQDQEVYIKDSFGLATLHKNNRIVQCVLPGIGHHSWYTDPVAFQLCIEPHL